MTKRSAQRHASQSGCMWNVFSLFDFRQGRSTTKLLTDRKRESKQGIGHSNGQKVQSRWAEKSETTDDAEDTAYTARQASSVKELVAAEMINEEGLIIPSNDFVINFEQTGSKSRRSIKKKQRKKNASHIKSSDIDAPGSDGPGCSPESLDQVPKQKLLNNLDLESAMEELARISRRNTHGSNHRSNDVPDVASGQDMATVEKLVSVLKQVMEERARSDKQPGSGEGGNVCCSDELTDALHTLSANKSLFLKLLQDQNSALVAHFQKLVDARIGENQKSYSFPVPDLLGEKQAKVKPDELGSHNHWSFLRRSKSAQYPLEWDRDYPSRIVVLKPGPAVAENPTRSLSDRSHYPDCNKAAQGDKNPSYFSFTNFKRKLRNAMGKERRTSLLSPKHQNGKSSPSENFGWSSPNRDHFYTERFAVFSAGLKPVGKSKDKSTAAVDGASQLSELKGSSIYMEAKKHLSDILKNVDENVVPKDGQFPKSLGRVLSFPEYIGSPGRSPRKHGDDIFITPQMRFSPLGVDKNNKHRNLEEKLNYHPSLRNQNSGSQSCRSGSYSPDKAECPDMDLGTSLKDERNCSTEVRLFDTDTGLEIEEVSESRCLQDEKIIYISSETSSNSFTADSQEVDSREAYSGESAAGVLQDSPSLKSNFSGEVQILPPPMISPSHSPADREANDSYHAINKTGRPSPVSVLEPLFSDDDISPASTISQPVQKEIEPRHIHFEEQPSPTKLGICTRISSEDEESAFEYLEAVLLGSGLNWDEFLTRWLSSCEILDTSLFDEVELFSSRPHYDQRLLFDCANGALKDVTEAYFGCFSGVLDNKPNMQPAPKGMDLIQEIWKRVESHLVQHPKPDSLEQLIQMDMMRSRDWMKVQSEVEFIGFVVGDAVFDELVEDFILSFMDDTSKGELPLLPDLRTESKPMRFPTCRAQHIA